MALPAGLSECSRLPEPIFTPTTKAVIGHDESITFEVMAGIVGPETAAELRDRSLAVYRRGAEWALGRGVIIADTKFEWGRLDGQWILADEVLTPDSSRFWPADFYQEGRGQASFDKQYVRDWLEEESGWDKHGEPPPLPADIAAGTRERYVEAYERITGESFDD